MRWLGLTQRIGAVQHGFASLLQQDYLLDGVSLREKAVAVASASPLVKLLLEEVGCTLTQLQGWSISGMAFKLVMKMQIILARPKGVDGKALQEGRSAVR